MADLTKVLDGTTERYQTGGAGGQGYVDQLFGKHYKALIDGLIFIASSAVGGIALPIYSATAQLFMLWNPADSGYNLKLICAKWGRVDTPGVASYLCWGYKTSMGASISTGAPCSAFTAGTPVNALLGGAADAITKFAPATATVTAPSFLRPVGISQVANVDAATDPAFTMIEDFEQDPLVIAPGAALFACNSIAASTKWAISVTYARIPV